MGAAVVRQLEPLGAEIHVIDLKEPPVPVAGFHAVDLLDPDATAAAVEAIGGRIDSLFNCAGLPGGRFSDLDTMLVNFVGGRELIEATVPKMPSGSSVVYVASAAGIGWQSNLGPYTELFATEGFGAAKAWLEANAALWEGNAYATSKQVINAWTAWRSVPLMKDHGIRLNCTNPGPTSTAMMPHFHEAVGRELVDMALGPVGRYSTAEEQAWAMVLLGSARASYVVGETLYADGGFYGALQTGQVDFSALLPSE